MLRETIFVYKKKKRQKMARVNTQVIGGVVRDTSERAILRRTQDSHSTIGSRTAQGRV